MSVDKVCLEWLRGVVGTSLNGRVILVTENEPLIAADIGDGLETAGAQVHYARRIGDALRLLQSHTFHGAVIDWEMADGTAELLCKRLEARMLPYVMYCGMSKKPAGCERGVFLPKPTSMERLVEAITQVTS